MDEIVQTKQKELQDICNSHFQEFVNCVDNLLELRVEATQLQNRLKDFNAGLQETGNDLLKKSKEQISLLRTSENILNAKQRVRQCLNLFYKIDQIQQSLSSKVINSNSISPYIIVNYENLVTYFSFKTT